MRGGENVNETAKYGNEAAQNAPKMPAKDIPQKRRSRGKKNQSQSEKTYLLLCRIRDFGQHPVQFIPHRLGCHTGGSGFEVLLVPKIDYGAKRYRYSQRGVERKGMISPSYISTLRRDQPLLNDLFV